MARMPWFAFFPADWLSDASLASCSPYARGVWIDLLAVAYQCDPAGILATDGKKWSDDRIARSIRGGSVSENLAALNELIDAGVARRMGFDDPIPGAIYSKRMVADMQERDRNNGRVKKFRERNASVTPLKRDCNANVMRRVESEKSREEQRREDKTVEAGKSIQKTPAEEKPEDRWDRWSELEKLLAPLTSHRDIYRGNFHMSLDAVLYDAARAGLDPEVHHDPQTFVRCVLLEAMTSKVTFTKALAFERYALSVIARCIKAGCMPGEWPDADGKLENDAPNAEALIASSKKTGAARYE